jgi:hypothetical protein
MTPNLFFGSPQLVENFCRFMLDHLQGDSARDETEKGAQKIHAPSLA